MFLDRNSLLSGLQWTSVREGCGHVGGTERLDVGRQLHDVPNHWALGGREGAHLLVPVQHFVSDTRTLRAYWRKVQ